MATPIPTIYRGTHPEFCPNPDCPFHNRNLAKSSRWYIKYGSFPTRARGRIHRFACARCGKTCSTQTFSIHYWTHRSVDLKTIDDRLNACSGYRQIGRALCLSYSIIRNRMLRIARNYLNLFDMSLAAYPLVEDIAFDGFESFVGSQYTPNNFNIAVGTQSRVPYLFNVTLLRRKGRMTDAQKKHRGTLDRFWRPPRNELVNQCKDAFRSLLALYLNRESLAPFTLYTDEKKEYLRALSDLTEARHLREIGVFSHETISSRVARTRRNPLFPVNYFDREIRKNSAAHARETVRFDREINMSASRMTITIGYHTYRKPFLIDNKSHVDAMPTHADHARLLDDADSRKCFERLYTHRHVWSHQLSQSKWQEDIWLMHGRNPPLITSRGILARCQPGCGWVARHLLV